MIVDIEKLRDIAEMALRLRVLIVVFPMSRKRH